MFLNIIPNIDVCGLFYPNKETSETNYKLKKITDIYLFNKNFIESSIL